MTTIETVSGPVDGADLGYTLPHEHVFLNLTRTVPQTGLVNVWSEVEADLAAYAAAGGRTLVDLTSSELSEYSAPLFHGDPGASQVADPRTRSRSAANALATRDMAAAVGLTVILGTGHYHQAYLDPEWFDRTSTSQLADYLIGDLVEGIPGTDIRAGVIGEIAADLPYVTAAEERSFRAAARACLETGALISTHAPTFPVGLAELEILRSEGVDPTRIVIGHADTVKHLDYSLEVLRQGAWVQYDCLMPCKVGGRLVPHELNRRLDYLKELIARGHGDRILLSHDACARTHLAAHGGTGRSFLPAEFPALARAAGIDEEWLHRIFVENPRRALVGE
jgi:predicted metal-dependent phosphotriesterase family hydrolase